MKSEVVLFILMVFLIFETYADIGFFLALVLVGFILFDSVTNHHKYRLRRLSRQSKIFKSYMVLAAILIVTTVLAVPFYYTEYTYLGVKAFVANTIFLLLVMTYFAPYIDVGRFLVLFRGFGLFTGGLGLVETLARRYLMHSIFHFGYYDAGTVGNNSFRTVLFFGHPTICALYIVATFVVLLYMPLKKMLWQYGAMLVLLIVLYGTKTRSLWLTFVTIFILFMAERVKKAGKKKKLKKKKIYYIFAIGILTAGLCIIFWPLISGTFSEINSYLALLFDSRNTYISRVIRQGNINNAINYLVSDPVNLFLGKGLGYEGLFSKQNGVKVYYGEWTSGIDNMYISLLLQSGIWGFLAYIALLILAVLTFFNPKTDNVSVKIGCLFVIMVGVSSVSFDAFGWRVCVFVLQMGIILINRGETS